MLSFGIDALIEHVESIGQLRLQPLKAVRKRVKSQHLGVH